MLAACVFFFLPSSFSQGFYSQATEHIYCIIISRLHTANHLQYKSNVAMLRVTITRVAHCYKTWTLPSKYYCIKFIHTLYASFFTPSCALHGRIAKSLNQVAIVNLPNTWRRTFGYNINQRTVSTATRLASSTIDTLHNTITITATCNVLELISVRVVLCTICLTRYFVP